MEYSHCLASIARCYIIRFQIFGLGLCLLLPEAALAQGASLADVAGNLKLKDRAWKVIKQTAEAIEANYQSEAAKIQQEISALEKAWDNYNNCPTCGVAFAPNDTECRVCGAGRPEKPTSPDPRQP